MNLQACQKNDIIKHTYFEGGKKRVNYYSVVQSMGGYVIVTDEKGAKSNFKEKDRDELEKVGWLERLLHVPKSLRK